LAKALGVGDHVDFDDLAARDREAEYEQQPSTRSHDDTHGSVYERYLCEAGTPREGERLLGDSRRTAGRRRARRCGTAVRPDHDVWVEHRD
jgi:hypothetical protein